MRGVTHKAHVSINRNGALSRGHWWGAFVPLDPAAPPPLPIMASVSPANVTASDVNRSLSAGAIPRAGAISISFWFRSCTVQSRSYKCDTFPSVFEKKRRTVHQHKRIHHPALSTRGGGCVFYRHPKGKGTGGSLPYPATPRGTPVRPISARPLESPIQSVAMGDGCATLINSTLYGMKEYEPFNINECHQPASPKTCTSTCLASFTSSSTKTR